MSRVTSNSCWKRRFISRFASDWGFISLSARMAPVEFLTFQTRAIPPAPMEPRTV
jgi:hypothetical protein